MRRLFFTLFLAGLIACVAATSDVYALSNQVIMDKLDELQRSVEKQQQEIRYLKQQLEEQKVAVTEATEVAVKEAKETVLPGWVKRIKITGDVRTRYEGRFNLKKAGEEQENRNRGRLRARLFIDGKISDEFTAHIALCTNMDTKRGWKGKTANDDMTGYASTKNFGLIRSYGEYKPKWLPGSKFGAGKFKLNFLHTRILWDPDCNPEGIYGSYTYTELDMFQPFLYLSWIILDENSGSDPRLTIIQPGFDLKLGDVTWTLAGSFHEYVNLNEGTARTVEGVEKSMANMALYGNTLNAAGDGYQYGFKLYQSITFVKFRVADVPVKLFFDYIKNVADDVPSDHDTAICAGFNIGKNKKQGDLSLFFQYAKIEPDSTLGIYNDSDFYGSNRQGIKTKVSYNAWDWLTLNSAIFFTEEEKDVGNDGDDKETRFMIDFVAKL